MTSCGRCDKLTWRQLLISFLAAGALASLLYLVVTRNEQVVAAPSCLTREQVATAVETEKKCLVVFDNRVYDLTIAKRWDLTGHIGQHLCGKEYDKETIEEGPHNVGVMERFYYTNVCGTQAGSTGQAQTGWPKTVLGMTWFRFSAYLSFIFFVFNFATCYAMPWASVKEPWKGSRPGKDKNDILGKFPLTHLHKFWAWLAIFALSFHGILGFAGVFFGKWL